MSGYARAYRGRWDHPLFKNKQEAAVWAWMTDTARWRAHEFQTRFGIVRLQRGQLLVSERTIADDFGLGRQQVRRLMDSLENASMINRDATHKASRAGTIVTIRNYEQYQGDDADRQGDATQGQPERQPKANPRPTQDQPTREEREEREEGNSPSDSSISDVIDQPAQVLALVPTVAGRDEVDDAFAAYDAVRREFIPGARTIALDQDRRRKLGAALRYTGGPAGWETVLTRIRGSPFLRGETSRDGFVAKLDWLLKPANLRKVMEGNYDDDRRPGASSVRAAVRGSPIDALSIAIAASGLNR